MRPTIRRAVALVACAILAACSSGTVVVVRRPPPPPPPPPARIEPLEITVARPIRGHLLVQTNRPSYVALFEIVPNRGVALLAPAYAHQRTWMLAGLNWVPISWKVQSTMYYGPPAGTAVPARWVYAIASDEPLRLPDEAFHPSYMRRVLGPTAYRGTNPHLTMRAISRAFVPSVIDEMWAEDAYALAATYASDPYRTVRIYCPNRTVYEVPEEMADRAWCPVPGNAGGTVVRSTPVRPDSVFVNNGQRMRRRMPETTPVRAPIDRVSEPTRPDNPPITTDNTPPRIDNTPPRIDTNKDVKDAKDIAKDRRGNGYGHTDDPNVKGRGIENEKQKVEHHQPKVEKETPVDPYTNDPRRQPRVDTPVNNNSAPPSDKTEVKQEKQEEKQIRREERQEEKQEEKQIRREEKQEEKATKVEERAEEKAEQKAEEKAEKQAVTVEPPRQPEPPAVKPEEKAESKPEAKPDKKEEKPEAKSEEKSEDKSTGKPDDKPHGKPDSDSPGKKDGKGKP